MNKGSPLKRGKARIHGGVAQLGEHLPCKQGVKSSNLHLHSGLNLIPNVP